VLLLCVLSFTIVWWDVDHSRSNWLPMFILLILLSVVAAVYALRGMLRVAISLASRRRRADEQHHKITERPASHLAIGLGRNQPSLRSFRRPHLAALSCYSADIARREALRDRILPRTLPRMRCQAAVIGT
jgi:hypothetical protein